MKKVLIFPHSHCHLRIYIIIHKKRVYNLRISFIAFPVFRLIIIWIVIYFVERIKISIVQKSTKKEQTATILLDLTRLSVWLHFTTIVSTRSRQKDSKVEGSSPPTPSLGEAGRRRSDTKQYGQSITDFIQESEETRVIYGYQYH